MNWEKIDTENLPANEVLAANFKAGTFGYKEKIIGHLGIDEGKIICESECEMLENCTHFIDINKYDND